MNFKLIVYQTIRYFFIQNLTIKKRIEKFKQKTFRLEIIKIVCFFVMVLLSTCNFFGFVFFFFFSSLIVCLDFNFEIVNKIKILYSAYICNKNIWKTVWNQNFISNWFKREKGHNRTFFFFLLNLPKHKCHWKLILK